MAEKTAIAWTRSTRNIWTGCTKVGPGCDGCYAEAFQRWTRGKDPETGEARNWGPGRARIPHLDSAFRELRKWNRKAAGEKAAGTMWMGRTGFYPVFLNTQSDFFDNEVPQAWRDQACAVIEECTNLTFFLVTKRIGNVPKMVPRWVAEGFPSHVRLLITVVNREEAERDVPKLLALPCRNGISYEPALEAVDWRRWLAPPTEQRIASAARRIEWIVMGGESVQAGHKPRPFHLDWARATIAQCREAGTAFFMKQLGSNAIGSDGLRQAFKDRSGSDPAEWPVELCVREFPR